MKEIKWFPGHMKNALDDIEKTKISLVDAILYVLDSRAPLSCMNPNVQKIVHNKPIIYVFNKIDLADNAKVCAIKNKFDSEGKTSIIISANSANFKQTVISAITNKLAEKIERYKAKNLNYNFKILVLGVPNTGKSSIINMLSGKKKVEAANIAGVTRFNTWVKINDNFMLLDTPGVLWPKFDENVSRNLAYIGCLSDKEFDMADLGYELMKLIYEKYPDKVISRFGVEPEFDEFIEYYDKICIKRGYIKKGAEIDYNRAGKCFIDELRAGKFGGITLD